MTRFFSKLFLILGIALFSTGLILLGLRYSPFRLSFNRVPHVLAQHESSDAAMRLIIPSIKVDLPIYEGLVQGRKWKTSTSGVSHLVTSPLPSSQGNSIIYGHNWSSLLGPLEKIKIGDSITIFLQSGKTAQYRVEYITIVTPQETQILNPTQDTRLTLYTCIGYLDRKRLVVTAIAQTE